MSIEDKLRDFARAYPKDVFTPLTTSERLAYPTVITKASADMGRHFAPFAIEAADRIEALEAALRKLIDHLLKTIYGESDDVIVAARSALETVVEQEWTPEIGAAQAVSTLVGGFRKKETVVEREHRWVPVGVCGGDGVVFECSKCNARHVDKFSPYPTGECPPPNRGGVK